MPIHRQRPSNGLKQGTFWRRADRRRSPRVDRHRERRAEQLGTIRSSSSAKTRRAGYQRGRAGSWHKNYDFVRLARKRYALTCACAASHNHVPFISHRLSRLTRITRRASRQKPLVVRRHLPQQVGCGVCLSLSGYGAAFCCCCRRGCSGEAGICRACFSMVWHVVLTCERARAATFGCSVCMMPRCSTSVSFS